MSSNEKDFMLTNLSQIKQVAGDGVYRPWDKPRCTMQVAALSAWDGVIVSFHVIHFLQQRISGPRYTPEYVGL